MKRDPLPRDVLSRKALVYVRQSTPGQVHGNLESQRRQYDLVQVARDYGFRDVEVIDEDQGVSACGAADRPGFERLVAELCAGLVGAVVCLEASRLARNGRAWHHLLELCGLVDARVIDVDGVYDPRRPNDRLLLGMKGTISEFEISVLRTRLVEAARSKAKRGELRIPVPVGYVWDRESGVRLDDDLRLQEVIRLVFRKFEELGSARQVLLWMQENARIFPHPSGAGRGVSPRWTPIRYRNVISVLNPFYAGAYAYGKSQVQIEIRDGHAHRIYGRQKPREAWDVLLRDHHPGYVSWAQYERNQAQLDRNAYGRRGGAKSGRGGRALLAGPLGVTSMSKTSRRRPDILSSGRQSSWCRYAAKATSLGPSWERAAPKSIRGLLRMAALHARAARGAAPDVHVEAADPRLHGRDLRLVLDVHPLLDHPPGATRAAVGKRGVEHLVHPLRNAAAPPLPVLLARLATRLPRIRLRIPLRERCRLSLAGATRLLQGSLQLPDAPLLCLEPPLQVLAARATGNACHTRKRRLLPAPAPDSPTRNPLKRYVRACLCTGVGHS